MPSSVNMDSAARFRQPPPRRLQRTRAHSLTLPLQREKGKVGRLYSIVGSGTVKTNWYREIVVGSDTVEFWNDTWSTMDHTFAEHDELLVEHTKDLKPGRALDLGCGSGGNAVWMAECGWQATAVDFSGVALEKARARAADSLVEVEFVVSDATTYRPNGLYDLITSFYIQLRPEQRAQMLSNAAEALAPGGRLIFVSHDRSSPPAGWSQEDLASLTTPDEVTTELPGLRIKRAEVVAQSAAHPDHMPDTSEPKGHDDHERRHNCNEELVHSNHSHGATTLIVAAKD